MSSPHWSPRTLTLVEANPATVASYDIFVKDTAETTLAQTSVTADPSGTTTIPVGSDGLLDAITEGQQIEFWVGQVAAAGHGTNVAPVKVPGGPFTLARLADGAESMTVTV